MSISTARSSRRSTSTSTGSRAARFTTCVQPTPRWEIASGSATVNLHDYALLNNAVIRVKDVPVFYLPVLYYPIQDDDRATGFLIPTYGRSTYRGQSLSNAFFWAINRSQDATFLHDWFMSRGQGGGTEYRYILSPQSQGNFRLYGLNENEGTTEDVSDPARTSYQVQANITQGTARRAPRPRPCRLLLRHRLATALQQQPVSADLQHAIVWRRRVGRVEGAQRVGPVPADRVVLQLERLVRERPGAGHHRVLQRPPPGQAAALRVGEQRAQQGAVAAAVRQRRRRLRHRQVRPPALHPRPALHTAVPARPTPRSATA